MKKIVKRVLTNQGECDRIYRLSPSGTAPQSILFEKTLKKLKKLLQKVLTKGKESGIIVELPQKRERK